MDAKIKVNAKINRLCKQEDRQTANKYLEISSIIRHKGNANYKCSKIPFTPTKIAKIKKD